MIFPPACCVAVFLFIPICFINFKGGTPGDEGLSGEDFLSRRSEGTNLELRCLNNRERIRVGWVV
jgi:hypothetical protein